MNEGTVLELMKQFLINSPITGLWPEEFHSCIFKTVSSFHKNLDAEPESLLADLKGNCLYSP